MYCILGVDGTRHNTFKQRGSRRACGRRQRATLSRQSLALTTVSPALHGRGSLVSSSLETQEKTRYFTSKHVLSALILSCLVSGYLDVHSLDFPVIPLPQRGRRRNEHVGKRSSQIYVKTLRKEY
ncbi:hypothetical protein J6590_028013 [Homalodisca vitripennis]|nr:hypothetical protein J6590_028013 [Homalodisca vitripennis]